MFCIFIVEKMRSVEKLETHENHSLTAFGYIRIGMRFAFIFFVN